MNVNIKNTELRMIMNNRTTREWLIKKHKKVINKMTFSGIVSSIIVYYSNHPKKHRTRVLCAPKWKQRKTKYWVVWFMKKAYVISRNVIIPYL